MMDYKNLTDSVLLAIIDCYARSLPIEPNDKEFEELKELAKNDPEFRDRLVVLQVQNLQDAIQISDSFFALLEKAISEAPEDVKSKIQESLDRYKRITN